MRPQSDFQSYEDHIGLWRNELPAWMPDVIFDAHVHLWPKESMGAFAPARLREPLSTFTHFAWEEAVTFYEPLYSGKVITGLIAFGIPLREANLELTNSERYPHIQIIMAHMGRYPAKEQFFAFFESGLLDSPAIVLEMSSASQPDVYQKVFSRRDLWSRLLFGSDVAFGLITGQEYTDPETGPTFITRDVYSWTDLTVHERFRSQRAALTYNTDHTIHAVKTAMDALHLEEQEESRFMTQPVRLDIVRADGQRLATPLASPPVITGRKVLKLPGRVAPKRRSSPPRKVRLGFIGAGGFITAHHLHTAHRSRQMIVRGICDLDEKRQAQHQQDFTPAYLTTDYRQVLADPDVDIVVIGTKQDLHAKLIIEALDAGKWVLLWKEYLEVFTGYTAITVSDFMDMRVRGYPGEFDELFPAHLGEQAREIRAHGFDFYEFRPMFPGRPAPRQRRRNSRRAGESNRLSRAGIVGHPAGPGGDLNAPHRNQQPARHRLPRYGTLSVDLINLNWFSGKTR